ncbi:hypothetical protein DFQ01_102244 [Paenibacillus cellulosilyticus]|uniref:Uncharacterized protein n=1 Tax=Paenibacillus cellulosilyticus TaxID=375489 RepID=A0A2V2YZS3_9BACL|nr:hypothetical protein [Paenibacillus cellulosilyticus]PWW07352.1 hypothetical protein DFQ01_102244 [Paenibacillus cellulosilyticus]QKS44473.1 hypothetical protein HUB94_08640 [Paenibacillus cellulosilyticus]
MSRLADREREVKLELVSSIARSQRALARILESIADVSVHTDPIAKSLRDNIAQLSQLQQVLTESVVGIRFGQRRQGRPSGPWINQQTGARRRKTKGEQV